MRHSQKITGIILSRINYREADKVIIIFSLEQGKMVLKAKGSRSIKSHRLSHLEPLNHISAQINGTVLAETKIINSFPKLKTDLQTISLGFYLCEVLNRILPEHVPHPELFNKFLKPLENLNKENLKNFLVEMLWDLGYLPYGQYPKNGINTFVESVIERKVNSKSLLAKINE